MDRTGRGPHPDRGKMKFKSGVCSSSAFPTESLVWIYEINRLARNLVELKSSSSILGGMIPDFEVLDSRMGILSNSY